MERCRAFGANKAQITIFVVLGLVILISSALIFYMKGMNIITPAEEELKRSEVELYVSQCLEDKAEEAVSLMGIQGGYIKHSLVDPELVATDPFGTGYLAMFDGKLILPYWYYQSDSGFDGSNMPPLYKSYDGDNSIQSQLESYIQKGTLSCIDGFKPFISEGYTVNINKSTPLSVSVLFTESRVVIDMSYPVIFERGNMQERYDSFSAEIPVRMKRIYTLAKEITEHEKNSVFLERQTKNFITSYSRVDSDYLPPMYGGMSLESCSNRVYWIYPDVEKNFRTMLSANIPYLKLENTDYSPVIVSDDEFPDDKDRAVAQGVANSMVIKNVSKNNYPYMHVDFLYNYDFPLELDFGSQGLLEPYSFDVDLLFSKFCLFEYKFFYNTRFPVLISITDSKSLVNNEPFVFQFPLEVVLKDNFPRMRYSEVLGGTEEPVRSLQCSDRNRQAGPVTLKVKDDRGKPVQNARVVFQCGPSIYYTYDNNGTVSNATNFGDRCFMGFTDSNGVLNSSFPPCFGGGIITIEHDEYLGTTDLLGTVIKGEPISREYSLYRVKDVEVDVSKYYVKPPVIEGMGMVDNSPGIVLSGEEVAACNIRSDALPLQEHENVIIRLERISNDSGVIPSQPLMLYNPTKESVLRLVPGIYHVDLLLLRNERYKGEMTIMKNSEFKYIKGSVATSSETIYYPEEDVEIATTFSGGAEFIWELKAEDLYSSEKIRFYIIDEGVPKYIEHVGRAVNDREGCLKLNYQMMEPVFG